MKRRVSSMKIPCRIWLLAATLSVGQAAFSTEMETISFSTGQDIAQQKKVIEVTGTVTDNFGPVIGATVTVKGMSAGVITDTDGNFKLKVPVGATIVVSYIGYENKEIHYKGERSLKIKLNENVQELEEVQIIAYGSQKKVTVTGALSSINNEELLKSPVASMANALTGKVTGLASVQSSGQPGADDATLYVRGVGSLSTDLSQPLMLVDGVERSFFQLDPNEVESITVLKDASATAVFGVRGANGVILVTTKRGTSGKAKVNFSTTYAWQMPSRVPEFADSYGYANAYNNAQLHDGVSEDQLAFSSDIIEKFRTNSDPLVYPNTDWTDMLIKKSALQTQHNFNISGGSERVKYFASLGVFTQDGLFKTFEENGNDKGFKYNRYNYRINMDINVTSTTSMQINLGGYLNDKQEPNYNNGTYTQLKYLFRDIYTAVPFAGAGIVDGKWVVSDTDLFSIGNYYDALNTYYGKGYNNRTQNTLNFDFQLDQKLDFLTKGLKVHVKGAYNSGVTITKRREGRANNINQTDMPEPVPFAGDKRIFVADMFYDISHPVRREFHRKYIRQCLDNFADDANVVQLISAEFTGPLHFVQFWLDVIGEWEKETGKKATVALSATKDVQDAILNDTQRAKLVDIIDIRYWHYKVDGLYAPEGGKNLAPRQHARKMKVGKVTFDEAYRAVSEYRKKFPEKAVTYYAQNYPDMAWAVFMASGSCPVVPVADESFLTDAAAMDMEDTGTNKYQKLVKSGIGSIIYSHSATDIPVHLSPGKYILKSVDPKTGAITVIAKRLNIKDIYMLKAEENKDCIYWFHRI